MKKGRIVSILLTAILAVGLTSRAMELPDFTAKTDAASSAVVKESQTEAKVETLIASVNEEAARSEALAEATEVAGDADADPADGNDAALSAAVKEEDTKKVANAAPAPQKTPTAEKETYASAEDWAKTVCPARKDGESHECREVVVPATCTSTGEKYLKCEYCHWRYTTEIIPKKAHEYDKIRYEEPETCAENGWNVYQCKNCANTMKISAPATKHTWECKENEGWTPVYGNEPSCRNAGEMMRRCEVCHYTEKKAGELQAHEPVQSEKDCTKMVCKNCGRITGASGKTHEMAEGTPIGPLNASGLHIGKCKICGCTTRESHKYEKSNDCTKDVTCEVCGLVVVKGNTEHNLWPQMSSGSPSWTYVEYGGVHMRKCGNAGCEQPTHVDEHKAGERAGKCNLCGAAASGNAAEPEQAAAPKQEAAPKQAAVPKQEAAPKQEAVPKQDSAPGPDEVLTGKVCSGSDHVFPEEWTVVKQPTCAEYGSEMRACQCGKVTQSRLAGAPTGRHQYVHKEVLPSCEESGVSYDICEECGMTKDVKTLPASGHKYQTYETAATCKTAGTRYEECTVCGKRINEVRLPQTDHTWSEPRDVEAADCTHNGYRCRVCEVCGACSEGEVIVRLGHEYTVTDHTAATCTEPAYEVKTCTRCGDEVRTVTQNALGHLMDRGRDVVAANCLHEGQKEYHCTRCSYVKTVTMPKTEHHWMLNPDRNGLDKCRDCGEKAPQQ